jgi:hypothetical protein
MCIECSYRQHKYERRTDYYSVSYIKSHIGAKDEYTCEDQTSVHFYIFQIFGCYHGTRYIIDMTNLIRHVVSNYNEVVQSVKGMFINCQIL